MIGSTFGHYHIIEKIGQGGMGEVFLAEDTSLDRRVALKFLGPDLQLDATAHKRLLREARSAAALDHPYICHINEVGEWEGKSFFAMEYVEGHSLKERLARDALDQTRALQIASEVAEALEAAHAKGIVHRDVKPGNIMLTPSGHAKVMDFGVAKRLIPAGPERGGEGGVTALTTEGTPVGTLAYMSPEQLRGEDADARSDIWALGATLYEMVTGSLPFQGRSWFEVSDAVLNEAPGSLPRQVSGELGAVILRCLEKDPRRRYQEAGEVRRALEAVREGTLPPWTAWRYHLARRPWVAAAMAVALGGAVLVGLDVGGVRSRLTGTATAEAGAIRLAVLPFENFTGDPEQQWVSDGFTDEMTTQLSVLHPGRLTVIGRLSVMRYKDSEIPLDQIGNDLNVDYVLWGSIRREADSVRITAELVQLEGLESLWTEVFNREMSGILALQTDVARRVAEALTLSLLPSEEARLANVRSVDTAAYEAYVKGTQARLALTAGGLETAERYFRLALQIDPNYAAAWAGIARVWNGRGQMGIATASDANANSREAVLNALALDENEWAAHWALAGLLTWGEWDWQAAEVEWDRVLKDNPNEGEALASHSHFLMNMGRHEEAMAQIERALELDPFNVKAQSFYVTDLVYVRRYEDAIAAARETMRLQPDAPVARNGLYYALFMESRFDDCLELDRGTFGNDPELLSALGRGQAEGGFHGAQQKIAEVLAGRIGSPGGPSAYAVALRYLYSGDHDQTLLWLEEAYQEGDHNMPYLGLPIYDPLRPDPRFQELMRRMGLPS